MQTKEKRTLVRLSLLAAALFFVIGGPLPIWMERIIPALSPLTLIAESVAQRAWYAGLFWALPPLAVLVLAVFKGRFFCQWICPLGTLYSLPPKTRLKRKILPVRLNALMFWIILSAAAFGIPALLFLDPLSTFSRIGAPGAWIPGLLIPVMLLLSLFQPQVWCTHLCPLGYSFDLAHARNGKKVFQRDRRQFIAGLGIGIPSALILSKFTTASARPSILPPGATDRFAETCTRCYACISACPEKIIRVKSRGGLTELFMPELRFDSGSCEPDCTRCSQVCPTGAIRPLTPEKKLETKIGIARVQRGRCLAWADKKLCMVCDQHCPYNAIQTHWHNDVACPVVDPDLCRGCGACETVCPPLRAGKAITVHPIRT